jgi:hypothetical protein
MEGTGSWFNKLAQIQVKASSKIDRVNTQHEPLKEQ